MGTSFQDDVTRWMNQAGKYDVLPYEQIDAIATRIQALDPSDREYNDLVNKIVLHNLRLVIRFVKSFVDYKADRKWGDQDTLDYLQQGFFGLRRAAQMYDPSKGYKFSTYANGWMRSFVGRYNLKLCSQFNISEIAVRDAWHFVKHGFVRHKNMETKEDKAKVLQYVGQVFAAQNPVSLDAFVGEDNSITISDYLIADADADGHAEISKFMDLINVPGISELQNQILRNIFLDDMSIQEVSNLHGMSNGQVQSLKKSSFAIIRKSIAV